MKGLLLNDEYHMWHSVLNGTKTQTRRNHSCLDDINEVEGRYELITTDIIDGKLQAMFKDTATGKIKIANSRYCINEEVYLQEPVLNLNPYITNEDTVCYRYPDKNGDTDCLAYKPLIDAAINKGAKWQNKMFMKPHYARFYVKITNIKIEPLIKISEADCIKEGILSEQHDAAQKTYPPHECFPIKIKTKYYYTHKNVKVFFNTPQEAYFSLLKQVGKPLLNPNPWLFAYDFNLINKPE